MFDIYSEKILILDFGSQTTQLIARRVRELNVYCEIYPCTISIRDIIAYSPKGIILSGSPVSIYDKNALFLDPSILRLGIPILGICYGMQVITYLLGGVVTRSIRREYGPARMYVRLALGPFSNFEVSVLYKVWMSHSDCIDKMPPNFVSLAQTSNSLIAAMGDIKRKIYGVQFHPEVVHSICGSALISSFVLNECGCQGLWTMGSFLKSTISYLRNKLVGKKVICALSGGVDSSVVAVLLSKVVGKDLISIFVDNGMLRTRELFDVVDLLRDILGDNLRVVNGSNFFLDRLKGVINPEDKRRIIGQTFIEIFENEASCFGGIDYLAQGTLYPDIIESQSFKGPSVIIKSHHNVGGLPVGLKFRLIEPLRELFKDECRKIARMLSLPEDIINRQPFPGPGLAIRVIGEVSKNRLNILRNADFILQEEICAASYYNKIWQSFAILIPINTVGVMGDERTYENLIALRIVDSVDAMTADWSRLPYDLLSNISCRIINEVYGVNRVVLDISSKPPATIEWE